MAEKRMFAKSIIGSARFLRMPATSRLLYYDLGMDADDDGFAEAFSVMRKTAATEDDLRVLVSKGFVKVLNDDLVTWICDWKRNNTIKSDRYHPSDYAELLVKFEDGANLEPTWLQTSSKPEPEIRLDKIRLDKIRLDKRREEERAADKPPTRHRFGPYQNVLLTEEELETLKQEFPDWEQRIERLSEYVASTGKKYRSHLATIRSWAKKEEAHGGICQSPAKDESKFARYIGNVV